MIPNTTNWPIGSIKIPGFYRKSLCHYVTKLEDLEYGSHYGFDDEVLYCRVVLSSTRANQLQIEFNTQASSQWDSFGVQ